MLLLPLVVLGSASSGRAAAPSADPVVSGPGAQPTPGSRVAVVVDRLEPAAPAPGDVVEVSGTVLNRAAERFDAGEISLHLGAPVTSRAALRSLRSAYPAQPLATAPVRLGTGVLEPGARVPFTLRAPVDELLTAGPGVYPLQVTVVGRTAEGLRDLGTADTYLPFVLPSGAAGPDVAVAPPPLDVAWFLPLTDRPRLSATGGLLDDELASSLSDGGALADVLTAASDLPAGTVVLDPALLRAVATMGAGPYAVGPQGGGSVRPVDPEARAWLARLTAAVGPGGRLDVASTPFADADLQALVHDGRPELARQTLRTGTTTVRGVLGASSSPELSVPPAGRLDRAGADFVASTGATAALLAPEAVAGTGTVATSGTDLTAVVPDGELRRLLSSGPTAATSPRLAEQAVLAELAQAYLTRDGGGPLVLAPTGDWAPSADWASHLADLTSRYPWLRPVGLEEVLADRTARLDGGTAELRYGDAARAAETDPTRLAAVATTLDDATAFAAALPRDQEVTRAVEQTAMSALSTRLRGDPAAADARLASATRGLADLRGAVRAVASREITLTSRNGRIPVTLENNLPEPVDVTLQLTSLDRSRVRSDTSVSRVIQPGQKVQVEVEVRATSAGTFPIRLALLTPQGTPLNPPEQLLVRSTAAGQVAKGVTIAALAVLLLAVVARGIRAVLRRRRPGPPAPGSTRDADDNSDASPPVAV